MLRPVSERNLRRLTNHQRQWALPAHIVVAKRIGGYRYISLQATPSTDSHKIAVAGKSTIVSSPDATFEILGNPFSLLSASISPSQALYTRRGSLVGLAGTPDSTTSSLRLLSPLRRALVGIPFLYQKITSTTPINVLISTKSPLTSFAILQLDGTTDWKLAQRKALLCWTGKTLSITPSVNSKMSIAYWGSSDVTGRGLLALAGQGQIFSVELAEGETYIAHPSNILAYSTSYPSRMPQPYRFKSSNLNFQIPLQLGNFFPSTKFVQNMKMTSTYKFFANIFLRIRTWSRRTIWGDRLFLQFSGPTTLLLQTRAARVSDVLTARDVNEIADAPAGAVYEALAEARTERPAAAPKPPATIPRLSKAAPDSARMGVEGATPSAATTPNPPTTQPPPPPPPTSPPSSQPKLTVAGMSPEGKSTIEPTKHSDPASKAGKR